MAERKRSTRKRASGSTSTRTGKSYSEGYDKGYEDGRKSGGKPQYKRLYRSRNDVIIAGVCSGVAEYLDADPTAIRLIWILITLITGLFPAIIVYLIAWIIIPERP